MLFDVGNQIPAAANAIKVKFASIATGMSTGTDALWTCQAAWMVDNQDSVTYGTAANVAVDLSPATLVYSAQTAAITPSGTRAAGCGLWLKFGRLPEVEGDDLEVVANLAWVEIEFVTV